MFYKIPKIGEYIHVYKPEKAVFAGPDSTEFKAGTEYREWVPNDFSVIKGDDGWHLIGITHPKPANFINPDECIPEIHEAEWQLFHAFCPCGKLKEALRPYSFTDCPQILSAVERATERHEIWAPIVWKVKDEYIIIYAPNPFRRATSKDLYSWKQDGAVLYHQHDYARDPNICEEDGIYHLIFIDGDGLCYCDSKDLIHFTEKKKIRSIEGNYVPESPILKKIDGVYYLLYCVFNGDDMVNGAYDYRTYVHASKTLDGFENAPAIAEIKAHAPELFQDEDGNWFIASVEWPERGVSIAPVTWEKT